MVIEPDNVNALVMTSEPNDDRQWPKQSDKTVNQSQRVTGPGRNDITPHAG